jgi:DNA-binding winged helix-turn-helix (wHTH) protein/Flp pilus assembly protein TadD
VKFDVFSLGDVTFDPTTRTLTYKDGRPARLRNKSKDVLVYLLNGPNRTVTKDEILDSVWSDVTVSDESLVQCIADIRRIVGKDARQIVETVPREGYRINVQTQPAPSKRAYLAIPVILAGIILLSAWHFWPNKAALSDHQETTADPESSSGPPGTDNIEAYLEVLKGRVSANRFSHGESLIAERHFRRAIALDPTYARAYAELGALLAVRFENDWTVLEDADRDKALFYAEKAVSLDPDLWLAHYALGRLHSVFSDLDLAESHLESALSLQPENEDARAYLGIVKNLQGEAENAIAILEPAVRSHPNPPYWYYFGLGHALFNARRFAEAEHALNQCLEVAENSPYCLRYLIAVFGETGSAREAEAAGRAYASMGFDLSVKSILKLMTFHHPDDRAQLEAALRLAGVPE